MGGYNPDLAKKSEEEAKAKAESQARFAAAEAARLAAIEKELYIGEHVVAKGETLSDIALKHYKHATPPYWKLIYEANKAVIGESEKYIKSGMKLKIPKLPDDLK